MGTGIVRKPLFSDLRILLELWCFCQWIFFIDKQLEMQCKNINELQKGDGESEVRPT